MSNKTARDVIIDTINNFPLNTPTSDGKQFGVTVGDRLLIETVTLIAKKISKDLYELLNEQMADLKSTSSEKQAFYWGVNMCQNILKTKLEQE